MKRNAILHGISAVCSGLVYAFFALPFYSVSIKPAEMVETITGVGVPSGATSGYSFLDTALQQSDGSALATLTLVMSIITLVLAGMVFLASVFALLNDFHVIKNAKVAKVANWVAFGCGAVLCVAAIMLTIANANFVGTELQDKFKPVAQLFALAGVTIKATAGWALTIITTLLGLGTAVSNLVPACKK
ncbi:MAG: hypothetical protein NC133_01930 [Prevotella sp.]|nr:hypothetical protein [Prevotella sp.]